MFESIETFVLGEAPRGNLPDRLRADIAHQQQRSEELIGWVQVPLLVFFAVLYTASPKTFSGDGFAPVPWTLAAYMAFAVVRLVLTVRRVLPRVLPYVSVVMDISLLMILIWSFHVQYHQPAPFYLKAPTLLYVFIFIALRVLRFDPAFVVVGGLTAAGWWIGLVALAIADMPDGMDLVTRDYVRYLTSNTVLIGAEVDKVVTMLAVTGILALALVRARRMLHKAIADAATARDLSRFVPGEVVDRITSSETEIRPGTGERRSGTMLFTDIEGYSTIAEKVPAEALVAALNEYFEAVAATVEAHGGTINLFQGDAMLMTFNTARRDDPDHAANALRVALGIQAAVRDRRFGPRGLSFRTRCGINTGEVVMGAVGTKDRLMFTVHGDAVNVAARLEQLNKDHGTYVLASERTLRQAGPGFASRLVGEVAVKGREGRVRVYEVAEGNGGAALSPPAIRHPTAP